MAFLVQKASGPEIAPQTGSLLVDRNVNGCDQASFALVLSHEESTPFEVGNAIRIWDDRGFLQDSDGNYILSDGGDQFLVSAGDAVYSGTVQRITTEDVIGGHDAKVLDEYTRRVEIDCVCYSHIAERFHAAEAYEDMTAGAIAKDLAETYLADDGVTTNNVQDGITIDSIRFNYKRVADCLSELAELTGFAWRIDEEKDLHFFDRSTALAPIEITDDNRPYRKLTIETSRGDYRNRQYGVAGKDTTAERTESFVGDGTRKTFSLAYPAATEPIITVNGSDQSVGIQGVETGTQWFWNKGSHEVSQAESGAALTSGDELEVTYRGLYPIRVVADDPDQIEARKAVEGGSGVWEAVYEDTNINDSQAALEKALALLRRFGELEPDLTLTTGETGFRPGQLLTVSLTSQGLDDDFQIQSVRLRDQGDSTFETEIKAVSGEAHGGWLDFFRQLRESGREITVRENEVLIFLKTAFDKVTWSDAVTAVEDTSPGWEIGDDIGFFEVA